MSRTITFVGLVLLAGLVSFGLTCGSSSKEKPTVQCLLNSDCHDPGLKCAQGYCVKTCNASADCPSGERCIYLPESEIAALGVGGAGGDGGGVSAGTYPVCQAPEKRTCALNSDCSPLFCGADLQCRNQCAADIDCPLGVSGPQKCTSMSHLCVDPNLDSKTYDPVTNEIIPVMGSGGAGGSIGTGGNGGSSGTGTGGRTGGGCTNPETAFGNIAQGDINPYFVSGVGVRAPDRLLVFSGYSGPPLAGVGGAGGVGAGGAGGAGGTATVNEIFLQTFDADTGVASGPAAPLFPVADGTNLYLHAAAISSTGEIALLHGTGPVNSENTTLFVSFLTTSTAAGAAGVQLKRTVQIESVRFGNVAAAWSSVNQQFVFSWKYLASNWTLRIKKFQAGGTPAGGDTNAVPTFGSVNDPAWGFGAGASGTLFAVAYRDYSNGHPYLTFLDADGIQVGSVLELSTSGIDRWITVGGTPNGFVAFYQRSGNLNAVYLPKLADGTGVVVPSGAGGAGGAGGADANPWTMFSVPSTATAAATFSIGDDDGVGGVGTAYLETNGASFLYVTADGAKHFSVGTVISSAMGTQIGLTAYAGSFGVSLYESMKHATQVVASGCRQ